MNNVTLWLIFTYTLIKTNTMKTFAYRDFLIQENPTYDRRDKFNYVHLEYLGIIDNRHGYCETEEDCKKEIDEYHDN